MSDEIIKVLDALSEKVGLTVDWSCENLVPYFKQLCDHLVNYELVTSIVWLVIGIFFIIAAFVTYKYVNSDSSSYLGDFDITLIALGVVLAIGGIGIILIQIFDIVTCLTFPEKVILDEIQSLLQVHS